MSYDTSWYEYSAPLLRYTARERQKVDVIPGVDLIANLSFFINVVKNCISVPLSLLLLTVHHPPDAHPMMTVTNILLCEFLATAILSSLQRYIMP